MSVFDIRYEAIRAHYKQDQNKIRFNCEINRLKADMKRCGITL